MKILLLSLISLFILTSCAEQPSVFYREYASTCWQTPEMANDKLSECVRINNDVDLYKWHKVKVYQTYGDMPDLD